MIIDGIPVTRHSEQTSDFRSRAIETFLAFIERKFDVHILRDARKTVSGELEDAYRLADLLQQRGIIKDFRPSPSFPDEPPVKRWGVASADSADHFTGGASTESDAEALVAAAAEALERYVWYDASDYFIAPLRARVREMDKLTPFLAPSRFAGFSPLQRTEGALRLDEEARYLWIRGTSLVSNRATYVPAQVVSGSRTLRTFQGTTEPLIRRPITTGIAVWPEKTGARLAAALEVIERDAYMITWLNQLTPARFNVDAIARESPSLQRLIDMCRRYRLEPHALRLVTDAPTYAVCASLEDKSGTAPRFAIGLKAHRSLPHAIEGAILEALRARIGHRRFSASGQTWDTAKPVNTVGHYERIYYWGVPEHAEKLAFLLTGPTLENPREAWETDTDEEHLERIAAWCQSEGYDCVAVSLGSSAMNPTPFFIESVVIPELQPTYLSENMPQANGARLASVPKKLGLTPRTEPFLDAPHPFA